MTIALVMLVQMLLCWAIFKNKRQAAVYGIILPLLTYGIHQFI
ncbi:MAG: hypothetical protein Q4A60_05070 [Pasteurellaceae bacterium]|nr:hypothetical protein [Pasteurellaceae bacterium]